VALAPAQSQRPDTLRHLLLVPADAEGTVALARTDARVVARYESFSLVEASGDDDRRLRRAGAERRDDMRTVETAAGEVDPTVERASLAAKEGPDRDEALALVQFIGPPKEAWLDRLRATGARIVTYQAENAYVVHARGEVVGRLAALQGGHPAVRAVSVLTAADKLEDRSSRSGVFAVTTVTGAAGQGARDEAAQAGATTGGAPVTVGALRTEYRSLSPGEAAQLARDPGVVAIEAYAEPELFDERAAQIVAGNVTGAFAPTAPTYLSWLVDPARIPDDTTFDFAVDVTDEGLDNGAIPTAHNDFRELGTGPSRVAYMADYTNDPDARDCSGHGTHVASNATGYNTTSSAPEYEDSSNYNHGLGVAPFARVGGSKIFECDGDFSSSWTPAGLAAAAYADPGRARISNNSWGTGSLSAWGDYSARSAAYDQLVRDARPGGGADAGNQQMIEVFAAGNDGEGNSGFSNEGYGTISAEGSAKNVITVGASEGVRASGTDGCNVPNGGANSARDIIDFSSRGPTNDGRLKPDLVAPGTHITGAAPQHLGYTGAGTCNQFISGSTLYSMLSGTSQAAPQVSGAAALVRHWYERTESSEPSPALTKALLVNTATDLSGGDNGKGDTIAPGPNTDQGWGRVNVGSVFDSTAREYRDQAPADLLNASGESRLRAYSVPDPSKPIKVTLAWTDVPGPTTGNPVVNNLDLVVDAGGRTYKGNVFAGALSRTGGTADPRNNIESVYLPAGSGTRIGVTVKGTSIAGDGVPGVGDATDQDFALVVSNAAVLPPSPVLSGETPTVSDAGPGGDDDGALEPGESFGLDQRIRNGGDGPATDIQGTMSGAAPVTFSQPASDYPDTGSGASSSNTTQFAGQLGSGATCGSDVSATLSLDTDQGTQDIPVVLPTGYPGSPTPQSSSNVPRSIPDDSSAGVSSTLTVANPGLIKDLDVSISRITHQWVGDLVIEIRGPDGTTVRLAEHPGGPDNGGKNLVDTLFDDEAALNISSGTAPYTGSFRPQNDQLSRFDGKDKAGTWTLRVRDLFEGETGTIEGWGTSTSTAACARNPQTTITSGPMPGEVVESTSAAFQFAATETPGNPPFECRLDGQAFEDCTSPKSYSGLSEGNHTFEVRAIDADGDADPSPASRTWRVDTLGPAVDIDVPAEGALVFDPTPTFSGTRGTAEGDDSEVTVRVHVGTGTGGPLAQPPLTSSGSGATWSVTAATLPNGTYTIEASQFDSLGHSGSDTATFTLEADVQPPAVTISSPAPGSETSDTTPAIAGSAGTAATDEANVTVRIFGGAGTAGPVVQTLTVPRDGSGAWATDAAPLAEGTYTVQAEQRDLAGNLGMSAATTFTVSVPDSSTSGPSPSLDPNQDPNQDPPPPRVAPSFLLAPAEGGLADALAGRVVVAAACASACEARAKLTVSARAARSLGLGTKPTALGSGGKRLAQAGTAAVRVRLTARARAALRGTATMRATLRATLNQGGQRLVLSRTLSLLRSAGPARVAARGLKLWTVCSESCPLSGKLTVSARAARRMGLRPKGSARMSIASGRATAPAGKPTRLTLKVRKGAKKALTRASKVVALLETVAGPQSGPQRTAKRSLTLRR
jgi:subtilisin-like proprotein convertase family protein